MSSLSLPQVSNIQGWFVSATTFTSLNAIFWSQYRSIRLVIKRY